MENTSTIYSTIDRVQIDNEPYYRISNYDAMRPFFMSIVSDSDHWMFISSNGALSAGRKNTDHSIFPYYTVDKIIESAETTGSKSIFQVHVDGKVRLWEPFSDRFEGIYKVTRNLYKNTYGNKILFEEINHDLKLTFRYQWNSSNSFGFVRRSTLLNDAEHYVTVSLIDGIQNILPHGVGSDLQNQSSNLVDAYKRSELEKSTGLGVFALSAIIVDKAEPSEALKANIAWSLGLSNPKYLLSSLQLRDFRNNLPIEEELDVKAEKGAYFINVELTLDPQSSEGWTIVANVNQSHSDFTRISELIKHEKQLDLQVKNDVELGTKRLVELNASADGMQKTADNLRDTRHFSNTLFNIMRGGIFDNNYMIEKWDFRNYLSKANPEVFINSAELIDKLPEVFSQSELRQLAWLNGDSNFIRLCLEYLPLKFSRRHGDPSRPWNRFSINTRAEDGSKILDYEGNWRDIFQNWEALAHSFPGFLESMIHKFLNASTFDGYNPYRITKGGIDWETIEPDDPWSYIGYWGDHQIIYLLKFLEFLENHDPGKLESFFDKEFFVYANVPYKIKSYQDILKNPKDTIEFDEKLDSKIHQQWSMLGADSALLRDEKEAIIQVNLIEKFLATVLAKMSNYIPEGGIWMNTQRPEWNDANNALVGYGVSMVTLCYLRRFLKFIERIFLATDVAEVRVSAELRDFFKGVESTLDQHQHLLSGKINDKDRKVVLDGLGKAGSKYRMHIYHNGFEGDKQALSINDLKHFVDLSLQYLEHAIKANKRPDHLYHAYNLMTVTEEDEVSVSHLGEMLEGQVAVLSSGYLSSKEVLEVLDGLKSSRLFREDQYSYLLYPDKDLPGFVEKNNIPTDAVAKSELLLRLVRDGNAQIMEKDVKGSYHFNGHFKNAHDLQLALDELAKTEYAQLVDSDKELVLQIFEDEFNHKAFTGRSGTFFGYEGLGSIYWHMVSKLQLAVQECCLKAVEDNESEEVIAKLVEHYYEINKGIGVHKPPSLYGAFPTDPYSHTPAGKGAKQPGMTGQVKEDIICRFGELGVFVKEGRLCFNPCLLRKEEFLETPQNFDYVDVHSEWQQLQLEQGSLGFTYCQIPIVYTLADDDGLGLIYKNNTHKKFETLSLDISHSKQVFDRTGDITQIRVQVKGTNMK